MLNIEGEDFSPEELASFLFNNLPVDPCSLGLLPYSENMDKDQASFLFEILITIYMEGILHGHRLYEMLKTKTEISDTDREVKKINIFDLSTENLLLCEPWFKSLGYMIFVEEYKEGEYSFDKNEYCKILLKDNPIDSKIFTSKKINKPYHFVIFAGYKPTDKLENIKAIFYIPKKKSKNSSEHDKIFTIKFKPFNLSSRCK